MKLTEEQLENLEACIRHPGFPHVLNMIDDIVETVKGNILSVPLDKDPEKAALSLYAERMKADGAVALRNAFSVKAKAIKERK